MSVRVLLAEDDRVTRMTIQAYLVNIFDNVDAAEDGEEAVAKFKDAIDNDQPYGLVFLDIMMPKLNGQEALKAIRELEDGIDKPAKIVMATSLEDSEHAMTSFREKCDAYVVKPITAVKLQDIIQQVEIH